MTYHQARIARGAFRDFGKGSGHKAGLNFGDCFAYSLAKSTGEALLFKGDYFAVPTSGPHCPPRQTTVPVDGRRGSPRDGVTGASTRSRRCSNWWLATSATSRPRSRRCRPPTQPISLALPREILGPERRRARAPELVSQPGGRPELAEQGALVVDVEVPAHHRWGPGVGCHLSEDGELGALQRKASALVPGPASGNSRCRVSAVTHSVTASPWGCEVRNEEDERWP